MGASAIPAVLLFEQEHCGSLAPDAHLAAMGAELAVTAADATGEPSAAPGSRAAGAGDEAGDLLGEALPDGVDESRGAVMEAERPVAVRGDQFEPSAGHFFGDLAGQAFPRQADQLFSFSRRMVRKQTV